jgi:hypothetical protein
MQLQAIIHPHQTLKRLIQMTLLPTPMWKSKKVIRRKGNIYTQKKFFKSCLKNYVSDHF